MTIDQFLSNIDPTAGWVLWEPNHRGQILIRDNERRCPIQHVAGYHVAGHNIEYLNTRELGHQMGLSDADIANIMYAADDRNRKPGFKRLRDKLIVVCFPSK